MLPKRAARGWAELEAATRRALEREGAGSPDNDSPQAEGPAGGAGGSPASSSPAGRIHELNSAYSYS